MRREIFEQELVLLQDNMYNFALSLTADRESAEDLTQDTTLKVLTNREKYRENTNFKGWVFTVMRNLFINNYHRLVRTRNLIDSNVDVALPPAPYDTVGYTAPDKDLSIKEINTAIEALDDDFKLPFSMYVAGYKYREIADAINIPIGTVKSRIFFARKTLQQSLADYDS